MQLEVNDATAKMISKFRNNGGKDTLECLAVMWNEAYKAYKNSPSEHKDLPLDGISILTSLIIHLNEE